MLCSVLGIVYTYAQDHVVSGDLILGDEKENVLKFFNNNSFYRLQSSVEKSDYVFFIYTPQRKGAGEYHLQFKNNKLIYVYTNPEYLFSKYVNDEYTELVVKYGVPSMVVNTTMVWKLENLNIRFSYSEVDHNINIFDTHNHPPTYPCSITYEYSIPNTPPSKSQNSEGYVASGSGFVLTTNGIIATNYHVVEGMENVDVFVNRNGAVKKYKAKVLISDKTNDLSLLQIDDASFTLFPAIPYAVRTNIQDVGTSVFALGYPMSNILGEEIKATDGIISSKTGYQGDIVTYQISAPIQPGNSGGPLFDKQGNLIGITNAGIPDAQNVGYAIKASYLRNLTDAAPMSIVLPTNNAISGLSFTEKIKRLTPYVVLIKVN